MAYPDLSKARWFKAKASESAQGCFEVAILDGGLVALQDSKAPERGAQVYPADVWSSWLENLREGIYTGHRIQMLFVPGGVVVRDSNDPGAVEHQYTDFELECFLLGVRGREFDLAC